MCLVPKAFLLQYFHFPHSWSAFYHSVDFNIFIYRCGNMRKDSGHVVCCFDQSASFRIFDSTFYFPIPQFRILPTPWIATSRKIFVTLSMWIHSTCCLLRVLVCMWGVAHVTIPDHTARWLHLIVHRGTAWLSTIRSSNTCANSHSYLIFPPFVYRISTIKLAVNNEGGSNWERLCDVLVCDKYDKYTISDKM